MTSSPCSSNVSRQHHSLPTHQPHNSQSYASPRDIDVIKRDRFELLSAYLDGEVTPAERQLVNTWLTQDPTAKCLYNRLLQLRQGFKSCPPEPLSSTPDETVASVFQCLNKRFQKTCMAGAGVLAIGTLGLLSGVFGPRYAPMQWASDSSSSVANADVLQVALDKPAFPIPQASDAAPSLSTMSGQFNEPSNSEL
ncbi:MAG TPA: hypothetical protein V6D29_04470 [Leptolyngbyaceae cyanobacterium]